MIQHSAKQWRLLRSLHERPSLVLTAGIRALILIVGLWLLATSTNDTLRLFGLLAVVFGVFRLYILYRALSHEMDDERSE